MCVGMGLCACVPVCCGHTFAPVSVKTSQPYFGSWKVPAPPCEPLGVSKIAACSVLLGRRGQRAQTRPTQKSSSGTNHVGG